MERNEDLQFEEELRKTLSAAVSAQQTSSFESKEAFADWLRQGERKRQLRRRSRIRRSLTAAAAVFVCTFFLYNLFSASASILPSSVSMPWPWAPAETYASPDSASDKSITEENGSIVIGGDGNGNVGEWTATFTSYEDVPEKYRNEMIWFENMPEGYEVSKITIENNHRTLEIEIYFDAILKNVFTIKQIQKKEQSAEQVIINQYDEVIQLDKKDVYLKKTKLSNIYIFHENNISIYFVDYKNLDIKKIEAIMTSIKTGSNK